MCCPLLHDVMSAACCRVRVTAGRGRPYAVPDWESIHDPLGTQARDFPSMEGCCSFESGLCCIS